MQYKFKDFKHKPRTIKKYKLYLSYCDCLGCNIPNSYSDRAYERYIMREAWEEALEYKEEIEKARS